MSPRGLTETLDDVLGTSMFAVGRPANEGASIAIVAGVCFTSFRDCSSA